MRKNGQLYRCNAWTSQILELTETDPLSTDSNEYQASIRTSTRDFAELRKREMENQVSAFRLLVIWSRRTACSSLLSGGRQDSADHSELVNVDWVSKSPRGKRLNAGHGRPNKTEFAVA
jgi:hypothetical protein